MIGAHRSASAVERRFRRGGGFEWNGLPVHRRTRPTNLGQAVARMSPNPAMKRLTTMSPGSETRAMHDTLFLFGATGDLAQRYLFPSLLRLLGDGLLPEDFRIRALALSGHDTEAFHDILRPRLQQAMPMATQDDIGALLRRIDYRSVDLRDVDSVAAAVADLVHRKCVSYLAIPPGLYISTCEGLARRRARRAGTADAGEADRQRQRERRGDHQHHRPVDRRGPRVPPRPLPGQGRGAEPDRTALRQHAAGSGVEPQLHRIGAYPGGRERGRGRP